MKTIFWNWEHQGVWNKPHQCILFTLIQLTMSGSHSLSLLFWSFSSDWKRINYCSFPWRRRRRRRNWNTILCKDLKKTLQVFKKLALSQRAVAIHLFAFKYFSSDNLGKGFRLRIVFNQDVTRNQLTNWTLPRRIVLSNHWHDPRLQDNYPKRRRGISLSGLSACPPDYLGEAKIATSANDDEI